MSRKSNVIAVVLSAFINGAIIAGCSEEIRLVAVDDDETSTVQKYFPLASGSITDYVIEDNLNEISSHYRCFVGGSALIDGRVAVSWISHFADHPSVRDTGYFYVSGDAVYYYEDDQAAAEKILETPFEVGHSWERFEPAASEELDTNNIIYIVNDNNFIHKGDTSAVDDGDENDAGDDAIQSIIPRKNYPTAGDNYFVISAIEDIRLDNGAVYENCLRVQNSCGDYFNYYWYAPGAGLVKFVNNVKADDYPEGKVKGEISSGPKF
jgi:hypothetical protein